MPNYFYVILKTEMKLKKQAYLSLFFLCCFLASFSLNAFNGYECTLPLKSETIKKEKLSISSNQEKLPYSNDYLFDENESETENDFHIQSFTLPFFIVYFLHERVYLTLQSVKSPKNKLSNPIYIAVCNFRI